MSMVKRGRAFHGRAFNIPDWMLKLSTLISTPLQSTSELELGIYGNMADVRLLLSRPLCFLVSKFGKIESKCLKSILMEFFDPADISTAKKQLLEDIISMKLDENRFNQQPVQKATRFKKALMTIFSLAFIRRRNVVEKNLNKKQ